MAQRFKNVYFADIDGASTQERNLTLAFGEKDEQLYEGLKSLSSQEMRERLGHASYEGLCRAAEGEGLPLNGYCLRRLRTVRERSGPEAEGGFFPQMRDFARPLIDPVQVTFRGGQAEPLHRWYPYLEGYSPRFVEQALDAFAPQAGCILDPFSGTGTTPLTAARLGRRAFFCELNPLLQFLIEAKTAAFNLKAEERERCVGKLLELAEGLAELVSARREALDLDEAYWRTFGESQFFERQVYGEILRARSIVDGLACEDPVAARFLTVAIVASLIPASRLIRRGNLRFKTESESRKSRTGFIPCVRLQLRLMAGDLRAVQPLPETPKLVCEDARQLDQLLPLEVDAVLTSPPYLNGTNYFRNTKVELWFLRCLRGPDDLADFRLKAVTAGINDVTNAKAGREVPPEARPVVALVAESAYDARIPRMVASYFAEMKAIFAALRKHLTERATVVLNIGDSAYGNVHVPTDRILTEIL